MYYDKIKKGISFEQNKNTIEWNDPILNEYRDFCNNINDKSYDISFDENGIPIIKRYKLNENNERYSSYSDNIIDGFIQPLLDNIDDIEKQIFEAKQYLISTDYKVLPDYDKSNDDILLTRQEKRELIRKLEGVKNGGSI